MFLHLPPLPSLHSPSRKPPSPSSSKALALLFHSFEDSLVVLLRSLIPGPGSGAGHVPAVSFSSLSRAAGVLSSVHALSDSLISDPALSGADEAAVASYIASSVKLLDVCNAVSAEIERLHRGRLLLLFAAHLLSSGTPPPADKIRKARDAVIEWEGSSPRCGISAATVDLIRDLSRIEPPSRGRGTALGRAIYAVEAVSALIAGAFVAFLGGEVDLAAGPKAPGDFAWGKAFNELRAALSVEIRGRCPGEGLRVEASVRSLAEILDDPADDNDKKADRLRSAVKDVELATEALTEALDRVSGAVNGLFRTVLGTRNTAVQSFRLRPNKCK